jgi:hypothetical protein
VLVFVFVSWAVRVWAPNDGGDVYLIAGSKNVRLVWATRASLCFFFGVLVVC